MAIFSVFCALKYTKEKNECGIDEQEHNHKTISLPTYEGFDYGKTLSMNKYIIENYCDIFLYFTEQLDSFLLLKIAFESLDQEPTESDNIC